MGEIEVKPVLRPLPWVEPGLDKPPSSLSIRGTRCPQSSLWGLEPMGVVDLSSGADAGFLFLFFEGGIVFFVKRMFVFLPSYLVFRALRLRELCGL